MAFPAELCYLFCVKVTFLSSSLVSLLRLVSLGAQKDRGEARCGANLS